MQQITSSVTMFVFKYDTGVKYQKIDKNICEWLDNHQLHYTIISPKPLKLNISTVLLAVVSPYSR